MPITKEFLKQLREIEKGSTPVPWEDLYEPGQGFEGRADIRSDNDGEVVGATYRGKDASFICALRNNIIPLLDELERLQGENEKLQAQIGTFRWEAVKKWAYKEYGLNQKEWYEDAEYWETFVGGIGSERHRRPNLSKIVAEAERRGQVKAWEEMSLTLTNMREHLEADRPWITKQDYESYEDAINVMQGKLDAKLSALSLTHKKRYEPTWI